jgi:hypothetical protein
MGEHLKALLTGLPWTLGFMAVGGVIGWTVSGKAGPLAAFIVFVGAVVCLLLTISYAMGCMIQFRRKLRP